MFNYQIYQRSIYEKNKKKLCFFFVTTEIVTKFAIPKMKGNVLF